MLPIDGEVEGSADAGIVERRHARVEPGVLRLGQDPRPQPRPHAGAQRCKLRGSRIARQLRDVDPAVFGAAIRARSSSIVTSIRSAKPAGRRSAPAARK